MLQSLDEDAELPTSQSDRALFLMNGLLAGCEGKPMAAMHYRTLRAEFMADPVLAKVAPAFLRICQDPSAFWAHIKGVSPQWEPRRQYVRDAFQPLLAQLERPATPGAAAIGEALGAYDGERVQADWRRATERVASDPEAAITAARTLLESVCKHILEDAKGEGNGYSETDDLPKLYRAAGDVLNISPSLHTDEVFKRILGGCVSVVEGLGTLRNRLGDAHGSGRRPVRVGQRHAALAVHLSGAMAAFLVETWAEKRDAATKP